MTRLEYGGRIYEQSWGGSDAWLGHAVRSNRVCLEKETRCFLDSGTVLWVTGHKGFIPYDRAWMHSEHRLRLALSLGLGSDYLENICRNNVLENLSLILQPPPSDRCYRTKRISRTGFGSYGGWESVARGKGRLFY